MANRNRTRLYPATGASLGMLTTFEACGLEVAASTSFSFKRSTPIKAAPATDVAVRGSYFGSDWDGVMSTISRSSRSTGSALLFRASSISAWR